MRTIRRAVRESVDLSARLSLEGESARIVPGRAVDLSDGGVGLVVRRAIAPGTPVAVMIEDAALGRLRRRRWRGEVVFDRSLDGGHRLGICFDPDSMGPTVTLVSDERDRRKTLRIDDLGPIDDDASSNPDGMALVRRLAVGGVALDQLASFLMGGVAPAMDGHGASTGSLLNAWVGLPMLMGIGASGLVWRWGETPMMAERPIGRAGLGLLLGGLLSDMIHRLAACPARPPLDWPGTPAQLMSIAGMLLAIGSLARPSAITAKWVPDDPVSPGPPW